jgi:hypothetical protein
MSDHKPNDGNPSPERARDSRFTLGVNYWPRKKAMLMWREFSADEIRRDFRVIRDLGLTLVRIFVLWMDFQPVDADHVDAAALANLVVVADEALAAGLQLDVTLFCGHMSGPNWLPAWMLLPPNAEPLAAAAAAEGANPHKLQVVVPVAAGAADGSGGDDVGSRVTVLAATDARARYRNPFHDELALRGQLTLIAAVVSRLASHGAVALWNLGNEIDLLAWPRTVAEGAAWAQRLAAAIREHDRCGGGGSDARADPQRPPRPVTCGLHADSLRWSCNNVSIARIFRAMDVPVMHAYPMYVGWLNDPLNANFVPFACMVTGIISGAASAVAAATATTVTNETSTQRRSRFRAVLMEEFGGCTAPPGAPSQTWRWRTSNTGGESRERSQFMASEEAYAAYLGAVLRKLHASGALGAVVWCFADYSSDLWTHPPCAENLHERYFGLVRPDGTIKPHAAVLRDFAARQLRVVSATTDSGTPDCGETMTTTTTASAMLEEVRCAMLDVLRERQGAGRLAVDGGSDCAAEDAALADWIAGVADSAGSCESALESVFRRFERDIAPKYAEYASCDAA